MTLFKALTGGAFDRLNWQHSGEFDQNFSVKKVKCPGVCPGRAWAVLELTGTLTRKEVDHFLDRLKIVYYTATNRRNNTEENQ